MSKAYFLLVLVMVTNSLFAQVIVKPVGCFAGTNGTNPSVLAHPEIRGVLLTEKWSNIEQVPGVYDFTTLSNKINTVKEAGLKYSLAISAGAFGSPDWLIDSLNAGYHSFQYQNQTWRLPLWWDPICSQKLSELTTQVGAQFASDSMLSHVYVSQMTVNGIEGHLNGVNMSAFGNDGFTSEKWIASAKSTSYEFANAFPDKPIVFEVHEIGQDTTIPATIINDLTNDPSLCSRVGLGMWWLSGKTTYQSDLIDFIADFQGDKYAQVIGRSDQPERFKDSLYSSVFMQAKDLNIRYIEPWPFEFQHNTNDSLMQDFNVWADSQFMPADTCILLSSKTIDLLEDRVTVYPNPTNGQVNILIDFPYQKMEVTMFSFNGQKVFSSSNQSEFKIDQFPEGIYFIKLKIDNEIIGKQIIKI